jgi:hypothetical protein
MAILNSIQNSALGLSGKTPQKYNQVSKLDNPKPATSQLDLDGKQPQIYNRISRLDKPTPTTSQLDLDARTPQKYLDNLPR